MDVGELVVSCVERVIEGIENDLNLIKTLIYDMSIVPEIRDKFTTALLLEYNIKCVEHKYFTEYFTSLKRQVIPGMSVSKLASLHLSIFDEIQVNSFVVEIQGHQIALSEFIDRTLHNHGDRPELIIESVHLFFPYEEVISLLSSVDFVCQFLQIIQTLSIENRKSAIVSLYKLFGGLAESDKFVYLLVAEIMIDFFLRGPAYPTLQDFEFVERCKILLFDSTCVFPVDMATVKRLEKASQTMSLSLKSFDAMFEHEAFNDSPKIDGSLRHVVTQLRRMKWQPSVSMKLYCVLKAVEYLNTVLGTSLNHISGADESFQYFFCCLADVRNQNFPSLIESLGKMCFNFVKDSRIGFLLELLRGSVEFISSLELPVPKRIAFPFKQCATDVEIGLSGFEVYAFKEANEYPSLIKYTGCPSDVAIVYLSEFKNDYSNTGYRIVQTVDFCFFEITDQMMDIMEKEDVIKSHC